MFRNQRLNFNQSLLYHSLFKSEQNLKNCPLHKRTKSHLLSNLNMTYSRLTDIKEDKVLQPQVKYFKEQSKIQYEVTFNCTNCKQLNMMLQKNEEFMLELERKLIQKQLFMSQKYQQLWNQLENMRKQSNPRQKSSQDQNRKQKLFRQIQNMPKLDFIKYSENQKHQAQSLSTTKYNMSTLQTRNSSEDRKFGKLFQSISRKQLKFELTPSQKDSVKQGMHDSQIQLRSNCSQFQLSYTSSQRQEGQQTSQTFRFGSKTSCLGKNRKIHGDKHKKDLQLYKLRFQNQNLKNYNQVLLGHAKPQSLAAKVFNLKNK